MASNPNIFGESFPIGTNSIPTFGVPACMMELGLAALSLLPGDALATIAMSMNEGVLAARSVIADIKAEILEFLGLAQDETGGLTFFKLDDSMMVNMSQIPFLSKSRGIRNLISRMTTVISRFGISPRKYEDLLREFGAITSDLGCVPTFPITAVTLKRHPEVVRQLCQQGIEFAVHGYIHTDYGVLTLEEQLRHFKKAIKTFDKCSVPYTGFRAPFVRVNNETFMALSEVGFSYDSSYVVHWDVLNAMKYSDRAWLEYERILDFYTSRKTQDCLVLPVSLDGFVEIPVSMPDDEIMIERLGITDKEEIAGIWLDILERSYNSGELFTLQLHPERIEICKSALERVVQRVRQFSPAVWLASLKEIAAWWKERERFTFEIISLGDEEFHIKTDCTSRATVLCKNCKVNSSVDDWFDGYQLVASRDFILNSPVRPVIGVEENAPAAVVDFLRREGYLFEINSKPETYGIYLDNLESFTEADEKALSLKIDRSNAPIVRYWRWPYDCRSALSVTGDIDSITLVDFAFRILENWLQRYR